MPSKLTGMLASGRPVVATARATTELGRVVEAHCGLITPPEDAAAFASAIETLADDPARRAVLGRLGRTHAEAEVDLDAVLRRFESALLSLAGVAPQPSERTA